MPRDIVQTETATVHQTWFSLKGTLMVIVSAVHGEHQPGTLKETVEISTWGVLARTRLQRNLLVQKMTIVQDNNIILNYCHILLPYSDGISFKGEVV